MTKLYESFDEYSSYAGEVEVNTDLEDGIYKGTISGWIVTVEGQDYRSTTGGVRCSGCPIEAFVKNNVLRFKQLR
jgi:hypothetical protein